ncbi:MAG: hypothetical protein RIQ47_34 [Bacteroidota bacterium]
MSIYKKLAGQTAIYGLSSILGRLLNYLLVPLYTRVFETGEYGVVTQFYAYAAFLNILFTYGLETAFFRFNQTENNRPQVYSTALLSLLLTSVVLFFGITIFAEPIAASFVAADQLDHRLPLYVIWFAGILACDAITAIPFARLRQQNKAIRFALIRLVNIVLNIGFNLFFLVGCPKWLAQNPDSWVASIYDPSYGVGYVFLSNLLASVVTLLLLLPELRPLTNGFDSALWKKMMRYSLPLMVAGFAGMINETFDRIMLPRLVADPTTALDQLGIYGACYKLSIVMTLFVQTFRYASEPFFFSQAGKEDARMIYARVMDWFVLGCAFIFAAVMLFMDIFQLFIGEKFRVGLPVVPILLMANLCLGVYLNISIWYKLTGKTSWGAWFSVFGAVVTVLLNFILIPTLGYIGAAWATLICYALMMVVSYFVGQRFYKVPYDTSWFFLTVIVAVVVWGSGNYLSGIGFPIGVEYAINLALLSLFPVMAWLLMKRKSRKFAQ